MYFGYGFEEYSDYQETVKNHEDMQPVLQVTELNLITAQQEPLKERIRVLLSVGTAFVQAKLGVTLNPLVKDEILQSGSILDHFVCSEIQKKNKVTCFNAVADQFFDQIVVGNLYLVSRGNLQPAQKKFNHLPSDYEITLDNASTIQQCSDSVSSQQVLDRVSGSAGDRPGRGSGRLN
ncbi:unnamed protein product, partial [Brassica oleracea]